jgi:N-acyl-D-amino-acid deacylase
MDSLELLIERGTVVDGTGKPGRLADVGLVGDRLRLLEPEQAVDMIVGRRIDARGMVVAPGFIDLHSHSGLWILAEPRHEPKVRQGVTSEVIGVDGLSYAPLPSRADLDALYEMNAGLDGAPDVERDWDSVAAYLERFEGRVAVNVGLLIGNSALRISQLGWEDVPANRSALTGMRSLLRQAMSAGALGLSSGLDYPPGAFATTAELASLSREAARHGGFYHTHVRYPLGDRFLDPFREAIDIGRRGEAPVHITHFYHRQAHPGGPEQLLELVDDARTAGMDVTFDMYPHEWASTRSTRYVTCCSRRTCASTRSQPARGDRRCRPSCATRPACSARTQRSSAPSRRRGRTARTRACWASSCATRRSLASRKRCAK